MKKILTAFILASLASVSFGNPSPELLKNKADFSKTELFESNAVFADKAANAALLRDYEANPAAYKPDQLLPVAVCYLSFGDIPKSKAAFESFLKTSPKNIRALRTLGTISLIAKDFDTAMRYYKTAIAAGDEKSNVFLGSAYIMANKADEVKPLLPVLEKLAKTNLEALNVVMFYAGRDRKNFEKELVRKVLAGVDARSVLESATPDGMSTVLRLYLATRDMWPVSALAVPARAAALAELWTVALPAYKKILAAEPNNRLALRGMGLVAFRTGDIMGAADYIMKAYKAGEKAAVSDGIDLFLLSRNRAVWEMFKPLSGEVDPAPAVLAELVRCSVGRDDSADAFYYGALGKNSAPLYADEAVSKLLEDGVKKYSSDKRSAEVAKRLAAAKPAKK